MAKQPIIEIGVSFNWRDVNECLPETKRGTATQVIVNSYVKGAHNENVVFFAVWYNGKFYNGEYWQTVDLLGIASIELKTITHWMPLPEPPKSLD